MNNTTMFDVFKFHVRTFKEDGDLSTVWFYFLNMIIGGSIPLITVIFPRYIIDAISVSDLTRTVILIGCFGLSLTILHTTNQFIEYASQGKFSASRVKRNKDYNKKFRYTSFWHLEDAEFHKKRAEAYETMQTSTTGYQGTLQLMYRQSAEVFSILGFIVILGLFNPWIILVALGCAVLQFFLTMRAKRYAMENHQEYAERDRLAHYYFLLGQDPKYGKDIRINDWSNTLKSKYVEKLYRVFEVISNIKFYELKFSLLDAMFLLITNGLTYYLVVDAYFKGQISVGTVSMTIMTILMISVKLQGTFKELGRLKEETTKTAKYIEFFAQDYFEEAKATKEIDVSEMTIEFDNVSFKYPSTKHYALKNVSFTIMNGQKLAIVGINGSGKSTIVKLLSGFFVPEEGTIRVNGTDICELSLTEYRKYLAVVYQDVNIYAGTVIENITGLNPTKEEKQRALEALKEVGLYDKIMKLENGGNHSLLRVIDEKGIELSGGEAQKLFIARALYKQGTKLMILDEPTASLDAIAEKNMYEQFNEMVDGRTTIMISHRLASTKVCDNIILLQEGQLIEAGTHDELMTIDEGKYKLMFETQGKYYKKESISYEA